jgi:hypothetical protein
MSQEGIRGLFIRTRRSVLSGAANLFGAQLIPAEARKAASILTNPVEAAQTAARELAQLGSHHFLKQFVREIAFDVGEVISTMLSEGAERLDTDDTPDIAVSTAISNFSTMAISLMRISYLSAEERALLMQDPMVREIYQPWIDPSKSVPFTLDAIFDPQKTEWLMRSGYKNLTEMMAAHDVSPDIAFPQHFMGYRGYMLKDPPKWFEALSLEEKIKAVLEQDYFQSFGVPFGRLLQNREWMKDIVRNDGNPPLPDLDALERIFGPVTSRKAFLEGRSMQLELEGVPPDEARARATRELEEKSTPPFFVVERLPEDNGLLFRLARRSISASSYADYRISLSPAFPHDTQAPEKQTLPEFHLTHLMDYVHARLHDASESAIEKRRNDKASAAVLGLLEPEHAVLTAQDSTSFTLRVKKDGVMEWELETLRGLCLHLTRDYLLETQSLYHRYFPAHPQTARMAQTDAANWESFARAVRLRTANLTLR